MVIRENEQLHLLRIVRDRVDTFDAIETQPYTNEHKPDEVEVIDEVSATMYIPMPYIGSIEIGFGEIGEEQFFFGSPFQIMGA
jgi:hypothetical protein